VETNLGPVDGDVHMHLWTSPRSTSLADAYASIEITKINAIRESSASELDLTIVMRNLAMEMVMGAIGTRPIGMVVTSDTPVSVLWGM